MLVFNILFACAIILILKYCWSRRSFYVASWNLPGKISFPLIGTAWIFWNTLDFVIKVSDLVKELGTPFGFWLGPRFTIVVAEPADVEIVINSSHTMDKGGVYKYIQEMIGGQGLFSLGGDLWKMHRRLLNPTVQNYKILNSFYPCFNENLKILVDKLRSKHGSGTFNIYEYIEACSFDMFCKTTFGVDLNVQQNQNEKLLESVHEGTFVVGQKIFQPWFQFEPLFRYSKYYDMRVATTSYMRTFIKDVLRKRILELNPTNDCENNDEIDAKRLRIFIDECIKLSIEQKSFSEEEMISESLTMLVAGYETSAITVSNIIMMLALYPEYQERVYNEIREIFPHNDSAITSEDLNHLDFTDRFIKETMRLMPTVPFTTRIAKENFYMGKHFVPNKTELVISLLSLHRNKRIWGEDADKFNPDHFLPENMEHKHAYSFIPFQAGARNCIGKKYALIVVRMFVIWLVRNYVFSTDLKFEELQYTWMIAMKLKDEYSLKIEKRKIY